MSICTNCGVEFEGRFFSGGGLSTCPECFRLQQFTKSQEKLEEVRRRSDEVERVARKMQTWQDSESEKLGSQENFESKMRTARTFLNAGLFDDAVRRAAEAAEGVAEEDVEALIDVSAIYICIASEANKPKLAQGHLESFSTRVTDFLFDRLFTNGSISEDQVDIPEKWKDALKFIPNYEQNCSAVSDIKKKVVERIKSKQDRILNSKHKYNAFIDESNKKEESISGPPIRPALRAATVSVARASSLASRLWKGIKLGLIFGFLSSLYLGGMHIFSGRAAGGGLAEVVIFAMMAGLVIGILIRIRK